MSGAYVTRGYGFTLGLVVTSGYGSGAPVVPPVVIVNTTTAFTGFGGGFLTPVGRKRKKKREEDEVLVSSEPLLQDALKSMFAAQPVPVLDRGRAALRLKQARGHIEAMENIKRRSNEAMARKKRLAEDDEELMLIMKHL